jgi:hypothetical protein
MASRQGGYPHRAAFAPPAAHCTPRNDFGSYLKLTPRCDPPRGRAFGAQDDQCLAKPARAAHVSRQNQLSSIAALFGKIELVAYVVAGSQCGRVMERSAHNAAALVRQAISRDRQRVAGFCWQTYRPISTRFPSFV